MPAFHSMTRCWGGDVVVVGGGTVGAWTAVQLAERGVKRVVLLEKGTLGDGASSRCSGHGAGPGRHRSRDRARHADPGFLRRKRRPVPARLRVRRAGVSDAVFQRPRGRSGARPLALQHKIGLDVAWLSASDVDDMHAGIHRAPRWLRHTHPATATSTHRATCWPTPRRSPPTRSTSGSAARFTGLRTRGRPRRRRRHLRRADRHRTRRAHRRTQARRSRYRSGREGVRAGGARHQVVVTAPVTACRRARSADGVRPPLRNLLAARRSRRPALGDEQSRRGRQE